jgi:cytochrome oxidase Cu insertion factor (SCO1/SenC/PrrC family)
MNMRLLAVAVLAAVIGGAAAIAMLPGTRERLSGTLPTTGQALVGGPFTLVDHTGKTVTDQDYRGRYMLIYFGFTHCPDICPSGLQVIAAALDQAGAKAAEKIVPMLITVDYERDTPEQLAQYVPSFHPNLIGLTGTQAQITAALKAYRVYAKKVADPKSSAEFTYDHSSIAYLMDPQGRYITHFNPSGEKAVERIAERLRQLP